MGFFTTILNKLLCLVFSYRDIYKPEGLYLRRWFITPRRWLGPGKWPKWLTWVPVRYRKIFLHMIRLDDDRVMHDHPWPFKSRILSGAYVETVLSLFGDVGVSGQRIATRGDVLNNPATHIHRLEVLKGPVWTLVFAGESYREWGFWVENKDGTYRFVDWRTYLGCQDEPTPPEDAFEGDPWFHIEEAAPRSLPEWKLLDEVERELRRLMQGIRNANTTSYINNRQR